MSKLLTTDNLLKLIDKFDERYDTDIAMLAFMIRQKNTAYNKGDIVFIPGSNAKYYLECTVKGVSSANDLLIVNLTEGNTLADNTVVWTIKALNSLDTSNHANKTLNNLDTENLANHLVTETGYDESSSMWYRIYDDGWTEQGGYSTVQDAAEIIFPRPFRDTNYTITASGESNTGNAQISFMNRTNSSIIKKANTDASGWSWQAFGFGL